MLSLRVRTDLTTTITVVDTVVAAVIFVSCSFLVIQIFVCYVLRSGMSVVYYGTAVVLLVISW